MPRYLYLLEVSKVLGPEQLEELRNELGQIFESKDVIIEKAQLIRLHSPLEPDEGIESALRRLTGRFGPVEFRAGSRLD